MESAIYFRSRHRSRNWIAFPPQTSNCFATGRGFATRDMSQMLGVQSWAVLGMLLLR